MADFQAAELVLKQAIEHGSFPGAVLYVAKGREVLYHHAFGRLSDISDEAVTETTRFDLASLTKVLVVSTLMMRAVEQGRLCLWDKLGSFVDAPEDKQNITLKQMLTHTAGFAPGLHLWQMTSDPADVTGLILRQPLCYAPGERVQYCCAGFLLLGQLLEAIYEMPLDELARREVFWPLKMMKTGYLPTGGNIAATERLPDGSYLTGVVHDENARLLGGVAGNAGVFGTAEDVGLYLQMLASDGLLPDGTRYLSRASVRAMMQDETEGLEQARGLGLYLPWHDGGFLGDLLPRETVGHTGFTGTSFLLEPQTGLSIVLLTNRVCPTRDNTDIYRVRRLIANVCAAAVE